MIGEAEAQVSTGRKSFKTGVFLRELQDGDRLTVYQGDGGKLWTRFTNEFNDGRFEALPPPPATETIKTEEPRHD